LRRALRGWPAAGRAALWAAARAALCHPRVRGATYVRCGLRSGQMGLAVWRASRRGPGGASRQSAARPIRAGCAAGLAGSCCAAAPVPGCCPRAGRGPCPGEVRLRSGRRGAARHLRARLERAGRGWVWQEGRNRLVGLPAAGDAHPRLGWFAGGAGSPAPPARPLLWSVDCPGCRWGIDRSRSPMEGVAHACADARRSRCGQRHPGRFIDTTTSGGRLVFHLFGALAQCEREVIRDRTVAGLASARARGRVGGRPPKLTADQVRTARRLYEERELTVAEIGGVLGVSRTSIYRALHRDLAGVAGGGGGQQRRRRTAAPAPGVAAAGAGACPGW